jgi:hypothetical protein
MEPLSIIDSKWQAKVDGISKKRLGSDQTFSD